MKVPDLYVGKRLFVGEGAPNALGRGPTEVRGSSYIEGPLAVGNVARFPVIVPPNTFKFRKVPIVVIYGCVLVANTPVIKDEHFKFPLKNVLPLTHKLFNTPIDVIFG